MASEQQISANGEFVSELKECAAQLTATLQNSDYEQASLLINALIQSRDKHIFQSVGRLTRGPIGRAGLDEKP